MCKTGHQLFLTVFPTSINIPSEYKMSTEKGYPLEEQPKQSPYAALAFAAASFAGVMSIGIINLKTSRFFLGIFFDVEFSLGDLMCLSRARAR